MKKVLLILSMLFMTMARAGSVHTIVAFGDSLSDNGNLYEYMRHQLPQSPPYYQGRFSNGPVWVELLTKNYFKTETNAHLLNYAFGGAGVSEAQDTGSLFTLNKEIDSYLLSHDNKADPDSLFTVWIGANNYLGMPDDSDKATDEVTLGIEHGLARLVDHGAKYLFVANLPDLGKTPLAYESDMSTIMSEYSDKHNAKMQLAIERLRAQYPQVKWVYFDVSEMLSDLIDNPESFGIINTRETCYEALTPPPSAQRILKMVASVKPSSKRDACDGYLFFDPVHPTALAHVIMAERVGQLLKANKIYLGE